MSLELNQSTTGEFISPHEVVLQFLQDEDIPGVEAGLSSVQSKPIPYAPVSYTHLTLPTNREV